MKSIRLLVNGIVQGVGFRPFVYRLAVDENCTGSVMNSPDGVIIEIQGTTESVEKFQLRLVNETPPLARIEKLEVQEIYGIVTAGFEILESDHTRIGFSLISPDIATCPDCVRELFDPSDRRYRYPFINCTNCGPRYTIIQSMPYDRPATTMSKFTMCPDCLSEYHDPLNRRFHAQPIACPNCGPQVSLMKDGILVQTREAALQSAREMIKAGNIVAVKGIGGFLLACDAQNLDAVTTLRNRKHRSEKPFALMAADLKTIQKYCKISTTEKDLVLSHQSPIVILDRIGNDLPEEIAPNQNTLGMMLPYSPLHYLICEPEKGYPDVLVMTSGNISEDPIIHEDEQIHRLSSLADAILSHDRIIHVRNDDSVFRIFMGKPLPIRRSRGFAPEPITLIDPLPEVLACGALLKNTFTFIHENQAFTSHFIGDLENLETYKSYTQSIDHFEKTYHFKPAAYAADLHPDFLSTKYAEERACRYQLPLLQIQHHHAHLAACMAENRHPNERVICLSYDGTGLGDDGVIWGGEVLVGDYVNYQRIFHLEEMPLPGGDSAVHKPYRMALAYLYKNCIPWELHLTPVKHASVEEQKVLIAQLEKNIHVIPTTSMGRLFDVVSALVGVRQEITYEGQAAIELENIVTKISGSVYEYEIDDYLIKIGSILEAVVADLKMNISVGQIAEKFMETIAQISVECCNRIRENQRINTVALSGGVWQNKKLFERVKPLLEENGFAVITHHLLPPNDGCISLGQAVAAAYRLKEME